MSAIIVAMVSGSSVPRSLSGRPLLPGGRQGIWRLWYEDEVFEDCDDPPALIGPATVPPNCVDQYVRGSLYETDQECLSVAAFILANESSMVKEDVVCQLDVEGPPKGRPR